MPLKLIYGKDKQVVFKNENDYYFALGVLASGKYTSLHWEYNEEQGAWGSEGRIHCHGDLSKFPSSFFKITTGKGSITGRINCNDYVKQLVELHGFEKETRIQDVAKIIATVPPQYIDDFNKGQNQ